MFHFQKLHKKDSPIFLDNLGVPENLDSQYALENLDILDDPEFL